MRKKLFILLLISLFTITACGKKEEEKEEKKETNTIEKSYKRILDTFIESYTKPDESLVSDIFPPFYLKYAEGMFTQEKLEEILVKEKEIYGEDFTITYELGENTKLTDEELEKVNKEMATKFNSKDNATECYRNNGKITYKGSKEEDTDPLTSYLYCKYDKWYIVRYYN